MLLIEHRINTIEQLRAVPRDRGVEIDIRDYDGALRLCHEPMTGGETLDEYLGAYQHRLIIFNTKCDGLEGRILELAQRHNIRDFFFLDTALPTLVNMSRKGVKQTAVRFSEYEPVELALSFAGLVEWVWVDVFTRMPLTREISNLLRRHFRICLASAELEGHARVKIAEYRDQLEGIELDAVCTDFCDDWAQPLAGACSAGARET